MKSLFIFGALLLPLTAVAAPPLPQLCNGSHGTLACGSELGTGLYLDNTYGNPTYDLHYLKAGTDWLEIACASTTCVVNSSTATAFDFGAENLSTTGTLSSGALSVTGSLAVSTTLTVAGATTLNGTFKSKYMSIDFQAMPTTTGVGLAQSDWTAYDSTAAVLNVISTGYGTIYGMTVVDAGDSVPILDATGLDITAGNVTDNDHVSYWSHWGPSEDRAFIAETDGVTFCVDMTVTDVSGTDFQYCGFRSLDPVTVSMASYTDYCAIGHVSGNYGTHDKITGATDSGSDAIADTEEDTWCITMSAAAGVCTYTIDGAAVASADTHDFAAGTPVVPFCELRHAADGAEDTIMGTWNLTKP